jgi:multidrug efflux system membrane fusion protein
MRRRSTLAAVPLALLAAACSKGAGGQATGPRPVSVRVAVAAERDVPIELQAVGRIVSSQSVQIRAQVSGTLTAVRFAEGQSVREGEVLFELDRKPYEAALAETQARLAQDAVRASNARDDATRYEELVKKEYVTRQQYDQAKANAAALEAQVAADEAAVMRAKLNLAYCTIRAPLSGRTGKRRVDPGNLIQAGAPEPLVTIEQVKPVFAEFSVPERSLEAVRARRGGAAPVRVRTAAGREVAGELSLVDNAVDPGTGTVLLKARLPNEDEALWPGQSIEARVRVAERAKAVVVPSSAVAAGQQGDYAFVVSSDGRAQLRIVAVDQAGEGEAVIGKGIAAGERVVVEGQLKLRPGVPIEILAEEAKPTATSTPTATQTSNAAR